MSRALRSNMKTFAQDPGSEIQKLTALKSRVTAIAHK